MCYEFDRAAILIPKGLHIMHIYFFECLIHV